MEELIRGMGRNIVVADQTEGVEPTAIMCADAETSTSWGLPAKRKHG